MTQTDAILDLLRQVELFRDVGAEELHLIAQRTTEKQFAMGEVVFREGDVGDRLFLLLSGVMHIYVERESQTLTYNRLGAGESFGEMAIIEDAPRSATVQAEEPSRCLVLSKKDFTDALARHPQIALGIMKSLSHCLRHANAQLEAATTQLQSSS